MHPEPIIADDMEMWESRANGLIYVKKYNEQGQLIEVCVPGGRKIQLTPRERRINQELVASDDLDVFQNGMLAPVRLIDSERDTEVLQHNSNAMSETSMKALFRSQIKTFTTKVGEITNPIALQRLMEVASEVDATMRQVGVIKERLAQVSPQIEEATIMGQALGTRAPASEGPSKGVTPR